jgi:hypothetical protein
MKKRFLLLVYLLVEALLIGGCGRPSAKVAPVSVVHSPKPGDGAKPLTSVKEVFILAPSREWSLDQSTKSPQAIVWRHVDHPWTLDAHVSQWEPERPTLASLAQPWGGEVGRDTGVQVPGESHTYPGILMWGGDGTGGESIVFWSLVTGGSRGWLRIQCGGPGKDYIELEKICMSILKAAKVTDLGAVEP